MTAALAAPTSPTMSHTAPPLIRLRPVPDLEPPYEDEYADDIGQPSRPGAGAPHVSGDGRPRFGEADGPEPDPAPDWPEQAWRDLTAPVSPPASEARLAAHRHLALCLEVLGGFRPVAHLRVLTEVSAFDEIAAALTRPRAGGRPAGGAGRPWRSGRGGLLRPSSSSFAPTPGERVALRQFRVCEPREGVAEVAAVVGSGGRVWAMALRLERHRDVWLCTHLEMVV